MKKSEQKIIEEINIIQIFDHWVSKNIVVHQRLTSFMETDIRWAIKNFGFEGVIKGINFYAEILETSIPSDDKKYFWTYKWGLCEFLRRGLRKFDGQETSNYLRKQKVAAPQAVIFKRK